MNAQAIVREHRSHLLQLRRLADRDLAALLRAVNGLAVSDVRDVLIEALPELLAPYTTASGELAAVLFEDLRVEAGRRGVFYAETASAIPPRGRIEGTTRWAVGPLVPEPYTVETIGADGVPTLTRMMTEPNMLAVQSRLSGSLARMIMDASRETMQLNGAREQTVRFQRMARPGACAFCKLLASRPPWQSYTNEARASSASHDECQCLVMPLYPGTDMARLAQAERQKMEEQYRQALSSDSTGAVSLKGTLREWRKMDGAK